MAEYVVRWTCEVHGSSTVEAENEEEARDCVQDEGEGVELSNIHELYASEVQVTEVEHFQD